MAYTNHLLFNNIFLKKLRPTQEEIANANYLVHQSARDWYRKANFASPQSLVESWIKPFLSQQTLDLIETSNPNTWLFVSPMEREVPLAICFVVGEHQKLDGYTSEGVLPKGQHWMIQAVNQALEKPDRNLRWVILTNGDQWRLLDALSLRRYEAFLEIDLLDLLNNRNDQLAAYLFSRIVRLDDSLERDETSGKNILDAFIELSVQATEATEKYLKTSVSDNLNTPGGGDGIMAQLCMGLVHAIDPIGAHAFTDAERDEIYRNATYLLYRLLFIFFAEARNLLPMDRQDYQAISLNQLVEEAKEVHQNPGAYAVQRTDLWDQLDRLFNAIHYSDEYMGIPPYNGGLFENEDKPYLADYKIGNQFLAEALVELAYLAGPQETAFIERIDYRDLSVRHLGSLYEGMIEYQLFIAEEELLARRDKDGKVKYLKAAEAERKPNDEILQKGKVYFAQSPHERKATGTHYTAEDLVERLVKQTVLRLLNERWQEYEPKLTLWLAEIAATPGNAERRRLQDRVDSELEQFVETQVLSLQACDPAMGSGHFLVHIAHQMTNFILWVLTRTSWANANINLDADIWRKRIVENCLYGVDINQMAVELAKLSLWLATMQLGQPLSFLDHHLKQGNSLLGASLEETEALLKQDDFSKPTAKSTVAESKGQYMLVSQVRSLQQKIGEASTLLQKIANQIVTHAADIHQQELDYEEVGKILDPYKLIGNIIICQKMGFSVTTDQLNNFVKASIIDEKLNDLRKKLDWELQEYFKTDKPFHWELEFPQIFWANLREGFDVIVGNPPFISGARISSTLGDFFLEYLRKTFIPGGGRTDLCAYFFRKGHVLCNKGGYFGFIATNTISQGDTRQNGLSYLLKEGIHIVFAERNVKWQGDASVEVTLVTLKNNISVSGEHKVILDNKYVPEISSWLDGYDEIEPCRLSQNLKKTYEGDKPDGIGFLISPEEANDLLRQNPKHSDCIFPFLSGMDINDHLNQEHDRFAICFHDWPLDKAMKYPELLKIVEERVKPHRKTIKRKRNRDQWWLYGEYRKGFRNAIDQKQKVLVRAKVSEYHMMVFVPKGRILASQLTLFIFDDFANFAILQSNIHETWLRRNAPTLESRQYYTTTDCFDTFPFPQNPSYYRENLLENTGEAFYEYRQLVMTNRQLGLTKVYTLLNKPDCQDGDISRIRNFQIEMDQAVLSCYGWEDIELQHDFYPNDRKKIRFMPSPAAQREIFTRLIALNQEIAAQEAAQGLLVKVGEEDESINEIDA